MADGVARIGAFGEVMMRLTPPEHLMLEQTNSLRVDFTGTGANLLAGLAHCGASTRLLTTLPDNRLGLAARAHLAALGVGTDSIRLAHTHLGSYFAEVGYGPRATQVTYQNRLGSAFCASGPDEYDFDSFLDAVDMVHICGISLSLTDATAACALELARRARARGVLVCFDFNFRPSLNEGEEKVELMRRRYREMLPCCDVVFGAARDLDRIAGGNGAPATSVAEEARRVADAMERYGFSWFAGTRRSHGDGGSAIAGYLYVRTGAGAPERTMGVDGLELIETAPKSLDVLDRIGAGDAYAAGIMLGRAEGWDAQETVDFAIAASVLAHTVQGDAPLLTREQIRLAMDDPDADLIR